MILNFLYQTTECTVKTGNKKSIYRWESEKWSDAT